MTHQQATPGEANEKQDAGATTIDRLRAIRELREAANRAGFDLVEGFSGHKVVPLTRSPQPAAKCPWCCKPLTERNGYLRCANDECPATPEMRERVFPMQSTAKDAEATAKAIVKEFLANHGCNYWPAMMVDIITKHIATLVAELDAALELLKDHQGDTLVEKVKGCIELANDVVGDAKMLYHSADMANDGESTGEAAIRLQRETIEELTAERDAAVKVVEHERRLTACLTILRDKIASNGWLVGWNSSDLDYINALLNDDPRIVVAAGARGTGEKNG